MKFTNNFIFVAKVKKKKNQTFLHLLKWKDRESGIRHHLKMGCLANFAFFRHPARPRATKTAAACWQQPFKIW